MGSFEKVSHLAVYQNEFKMFWIGLNVKKLRGFCEISNPITKVYAASGTSSFRILHAYLVQGCGIPIVLLHLDMIPPSCLFFYIKEFSHN